MSVTPSTRSANITGHPAYRAYRLTASGGIAAAELLDARDDEEAMILAAKITNGHGVDLWERGRFLGSFPPLVSGAPIMKA